MIFLFSAKTVSVM